MTNATLPMLIVGAGPTGLLCANLLANYGVNSLIIDKASGPLDMPRAIHLDDEGFRSLQAVGLDHEMEGRVLSNYGARYYSNNGECFAKIEPSLAEFGFPRRNSFYQPELEALLRQRAMRTGLVDLRYETVFHSLTQEADGVVATLSEAGGETFECRSQVLLACDGGRSTVRAHLGIELVGESAAEDWVVVDTRNDSDRDHFSKFFCSVTRPMVSIPAPNGGRRYEYMVCPGDDPETLTDPESISRVLSDFRQFREEDIDRAAVYRFHASIAERFVDNRVVLLGDAAHLSPPFAGQGMNAGFRDAHNVAWKVAMLVRGRCRPEMLLSYESERRGAVWRMIQFATSLGRIVMPRSPVQAEVTYTMLQMLRLFPAAEDYVLNMRFKPRPYFEQGIFIPSQWAESSEYTAPGRMLVQPNLLSTEERRVRLDDLLGASFGLIALGRDAAASLRRWQHPIWEELQGKRIMIAFDGPLSPGEFRIDGPSYDLPQLMGQILLVRPDRYIAAILDPDGEIAAAEQLRGLLCLPDSTAENIAAQSLLA